MISVVVPTYNEEDTLPLFLDALMDCHYDDYEIIVVDGGSEDATVSCARSRGCRVFPATKKGIAYARNVGLSHAKGDILASLDADVVVCRGWLDKIHSHFERNPHLVAVGGPSTYQHPLYDLWSFVTQFPNNFAHLTRFAYFGANNLAIKSDYLRCSGGWNEQLDEEMDLSLRLWRTRAPFVFDWTLHVTLSPRRFRTCGFFPTIAMWSFASMKTLFSLSHNWETYSLWRSKKYTRSSQEGEK